MNDINIFSKFSSGYAQIGIGIVNTIRAVLTNDTECKIYKKIKSSYFPPELHLVQF